MTYDEYELVSLPPGTGAVPQFASLYVGDLHPDVTEAMGVLGVTKNSVSAKQR